MGRLIILSGPSCVGKGPLVSAVKKFYPELAANWEKLLLYNSRSPRSGEIEGKDYYFKSSSEIEHLESKGFLVLDVRGDLQAVDINGLAEKLERMDVFFEGNPFIADKLMHSAELKSFEQLSIFLSPLSKEEIDFLNRQKAGIEIIVTDVMRRKLLRRMSKQKTILLLPDLEEIERRAKSAYKEMQKACCYQYVISNHDGEDSENWDMFYYPIGDGRKAMLAFVDVLSGVKNDLVEKWDQGMLL